MAGIFAPADDPNADPTKKPVDPNAPAAQGPKTYTANDPALADLMKYNPSWSAEDAASWANRYYSNNPATNPNAGAAPAAQGTPAANTYGGQQQGPVSNTPVTPGAQPQTVQDVYRQALLTKLQGPTPEQAGATAAMSSPLIGAFNTAQQRQATRDRANLAERAYAEGFSGSGSFDTQLTGLNQAQGERETAFAAQVAQKAMDDRRTELTQAIQMAQQAYQFDTAEALQKELAQLNAQMQQLGIASQEKIAGGAQDIQKMLGLGDLDLRKLLGMGSLDLQKLGLMMQNEQAGNQLNYQYDYAQALENDKQLDRIVPKPQ